MHKMQVRTAIFLIGICMCAGISGCSRYEEAGAGKYRETQMLMGTIVHIDVCQEVQNTENGKLAFKTAWERLEDIAWRMNVLDMRSDVSKINTSTEPVLVGSDTYAVIKHSLKYFRQTGGAFDITVWPLINLWKQSEINNTFPTTEQIETILKVIGTDNIQLLSDNFIERNNLKTQIDLGGIAKGYAVDEVARIFREHGILNFFIDAGGDVYVGGQNCSGKLWRVGIKDTRDRSKIIDIVELTDGAVATSGNYEQYYTFENQRWSHIIDPISGYPQKDVVSSTVIAPSAMEADALATALCVLGSKSGTEFMDTLTGKHASLIIVVDESNQIKKTLSKTYSNYSVGIINVKNFN